MNAIMVPSPFGALCVQAEGGAIRALTWGAARVQGTAPLPLLTEAKAQLEAYFAGKRKDFDLPLHVEGSHTQREVCRLMSAIPFGHTRTYGDIAKELNLPAQAVGQACGGNPIPIIIPCHRVLAANGLGGFSAAGGVETKVALLRHEGAAGLLI